MLEHAEHDSSEIYDRPLGYGIFESEVQLTLRRVDCALDIRELFSLPSSSLKH